MLNLQAYVSLLFVKFQASSLLSSLYGNDQKLI